MSTMANVGDSMSQQRSSRTTLGQCNPYMHCEECGKPDDKCPNMVVPDQFCACGRPLTQSDLWHAAEEDIRTCRYCHPAAAYIRELLAEISTCAQPLDLDTLWEACPWPPEHTNIIITHLRAAGMTLLAG